MLSQRQRSIVCDEWESSISLEIDRFVYDKAKTAFKKWIERHGRKFVRPEYTYRLDNLLIFEDGSSRLAEKVVQRKITSARKHVLGILDETIFPITRTQSTEETLRLNETKGNIVKTIERLILPKRDIERVESCYSCYDCIEERDAEEKNDRALLRYLPRIRKTYNHEQTKHGSRYTLECEIEYAKDSDYECVLEYEQKLMRLMRPAFEYLKADRLTLKQMFYCVVPKVQMWHCFDDNQRYVWSYKYNGIKGKFMYIDQCAYIWPDACEIQVDSCSLIENNSEADDVCAAAKRPLDVIRHMCMQIEIMPTEIVIVDVIAISYFNVMHTSEPISSVAILRYLRDVLYPNGSSCIKIGDKPVIVQTFYETCLPRDYDKRIYDGFIIVQNDIFIKWKRPTVDLRYVGPGNEFVVGNDVSIVLDESAFDTATIDQDDETTRPAITGCCSDNVNGSNGTRITPIVGAIYEIASNMKILRMRTDRRAPSTNREYEIFLESVKFLSMIYIYLFIFK